MKPFEFRLQSVKTLREHREKEAQERYAAALRAREKAAAELQSAVEALTAGWHTLSAQLAAGVTGTDLTQAQAWCKLLEGRTRERALALHKATLALEPAAQESRTATRDREGMDKLFEKQRLAHDRALRCEQQKNLDEMAVRLAHAVIPGREIINALAR